MKTGLKYYLYCLAADKRTGFIAGIGKFFLLLLSLVYSLGLRITLFFYRSRIFKVHRLPSRVISVGNITLGGTGKTPLTEMLAKGLSERGRKVAILSRGYGNDEPYVLAQNLPDIPILAGWNRVSNGKKAMEKYGVDTLILDDAFQHWRIARDIDIVTIDSTNAFGNMKILPRGILREPVSGLSRADIFVLTKCQDAKSGLPGIKERLAGINSKALIVESVHMPLYLYELHSPKARIPVTTIRGKRVCLVSGIAEPLSFENCIVDLGARVDLRFYYPDHYPYQKEDIEKIVDASSLQEIKTIITTEKDAVKLKKYPLSILALRIELKIIKGEEELFERLASLYNS